MDGIAGKWDIFISWLLYSYRMVFNGVAVLYPWDIGTMGLSGRVWQMEWVPFQPGGIEEFEEK